MIKIAHIADLHLDCPFVNLSGRQAAIRKSDLRQAFVTAINKAKSMDVKIMLIAGDMFDNEYATVKTAQFITETMRANSDMLFFITPGNHDFYNMSCVYATNEFPQNVHIFKTNSIEKYCVDDNTVIYGVAATSEHSDKHILKDFVPHDKSKINIMVCHSMLTSKSGHNLYTPVTKEEIAACGVDYLALGHIHNSFVSKEGSVTYAYSGCLEGRGFDELGTKGMIIAEISKTDVNTSFYEIGKRKNIITDVNISDCNSELDIKTKIENSIQADENTLLRVRLVGKRRLAHIDVNCIEPENISAFYFEIKDETSLYTDIKERANDKTLEGIFITKMLEKIDAAPDEEKQLLTKALEFGLMALEGEEIVL